MDFSEITGKWDYKTLPENIVIGKDCWIERKDSFARFKSNKDPGLIMGARVKAFTWTTFNIEPGGKIEIGDDSVLVGAIFMCADHITIGKRVTISYHVTIADSDFHPKEPQLRKLDAIANAPQGDKSQRPEIKTKPVVIEDDVHIGIGAIILKGTRIGQKAIVSAGSVVTSDIPAGVRVEGNPACIVNV